MHVPSVSQNSKPAEFIPKAENIIRSGGKISPNEIRQSDVGGAPLAGATKDETTSAANTVENTASPTTSLPKTAFKSTFLNKIQSFFENDKERIEPHYVNYLRKCESIINPTNQSEETLRVIFQNKVAGATSQPTVLDFSVTATGQPKVTCSVMNQLTVSAILDSANAAGVKEVDLGKLGSEDSKIFLDNLTEFQKKGLYSDITPINTPQPTPTPTPTRSHP